MTESVDLKLIRPISKNTSGMPAVKKTDKKEEKKVFEENMLFATLTTSSRNIALPNNHSFVLSDTVGFVQDLPHSLVEAFHSTLEEVLEADLLLHVIDASNPEYTKHIQVTEETLEEIKTRKNSPVKTEEYLAPRTGLEPVTP